ncbi:MAG: Sec-independent protein translocase subunit TatA/TatB [Bacillota bacterium]
MFGIGPWELVLILAIALVVFGPGKLPEVGKALGNGLKEFRKASDNIKDEVRKEAAEIK